MAKPDYEHRHRELPAAERERRPTRALVKVLAVLSIAAGVFPAPSDAGQLRCARHELTPGDRDRLLVVARAHAARGIELSDSP